ncbi:MAG TPA: outer membrane beta-barrel protein [Asticcacaulis sp.]|nr:outer membrane beta-barrel protein [Asticcacaulis sp.]
MLKSAALAALLAISAQTAWASDTWRGAYAEAFVASDSVSVQGGAQVDPAQNTYFLADSLSDIARTSAFHRKADKGAIGLLAGYDFASRGPWVFGVEGDIDSGRARVASSKTAVYPCCETLHYTISQTFDTRDFATARLRVGYAMGRHLIYATAGAATLRARISGRFSDTLTADESVGGTADKTLTGWAAGVGGEVRVASHWTIRADYLHADLGRATALGTVIRPDVTVGSGSSANPMAGVSHAAAIKISQLRIGLAYKF